MPRVMLGYVSREVKIFRSHFRHQLQNGVVLKLICSCCRDWAGELRFAQNFKMKKFCISDLKKSTKEPVETKGESGGVCGQTTTENSASSDSTEKTVNTSKNCDRDTCETMDLDSQ